MTLMNEIIMCGETRILKVRSDDSSEFFKIFNFMVEKTECRVCHTHVITQDSVKGTSCSNGRKDDFVHRRCRPNGFGEDDQCGICGDTNCQAVDVYCRTGRVCHHRNCRMNIGFLFTIYVHVYDKYGHRIIGDGTVEADGFYSCAKCLVPEMALEMERLFQGQDYSESLDLLFQPFHDTLRAAFLCNRCALTCLL